MADTEQPIIRPKNNNDNTITLTRQQFPCLNFFNQAQVQGLTQTGLFCYLFNVQVTAAICVTIQNVSDSKDILTWDI